MESHIRFTSGGGGYTFNLKNKSSSGQVTFAVPKSKDFASKLLVKVSKLLRQNQVRDIHLVLGTKVEDI